jgi:hypothetical protein
VVIVGGVVHGTWELDGDRVRIAWFRESGRVPRRALGSEIERLGTVKGRALTADVVVG